ncbi:hypothetical protein AgCh_017482 [Apium graveolens]
MEGGGSGYCSKKSDDFCGSDETGLRFLNRINHPNMVKIIGYCCNCSEDDHNILVLEYMPKGSLGEILLEDSVFDIVRESVVEGQEVSEFEDTTELELNSNETDATKILHRNNELLSQQAAPSTSVSSTRNFGLYGDAIFYTNRYNSVLSPFTGVDKHDRCVTFASCLLSYESVVDYCWAFGRIIKAIRRNPILVITDQCLVIYVRFISD